MATKRAEQERRAAAARAAARRQRARLATLLAVLLLAVAGVSGWYVYQAQRPERSAAGPATGDAAGVRVGTGPVTVDVYLDFMCPHCKDFETQAGATLDRLVAEGRATVVYHPVAFLDRASTTRYSTRSASASGCANDAGRFVEYLKVLYANQPAEGGPGLSDDRLMELAATAGLDPGPFGECVRAGKHRGWVDGVTEAAVQRNITGTPTVLVNGKKVNGTPKALTDAVAAAG